MDSIMIVDDEESVRELLQSVLNAGGYDNILEASGGEEAIELFPCQAKPRYL